MPKSASVFTRVDPEVKLQAEEVLNKLGISMSAAMGVFLQQIVLRQGIPFELKLPTPMPKAIEDMTADELNEKLESALEQCREGKGIPFEQVKADMQRLYGI